jgi:hypothetical protein
MMPDLAVVTVVTRNYLHCARALAVSVRENNPGARVYICLVDRPPEPYDPSVEPGTVFFADELGIPDWTRLTFQYTGFEFACALKPFALRHVLCNLDHRSALYFDSDIQVYQDIQELRDTLRGGSFVLTPHLAEPQAVEGQLPTEHDILKAGVFNAGFVGVSRTDAGLKILNWWARHLGTACITDVASHLVCDQHWLEFVPALFDGVVIERRPAYNVAYWNLPQRELTWSEDGKPLVNGERLAFFHFSGFDADHPECLSRFAPVAAENVVVRQLMGRYVRRLDDLGRSECRSWGYAHDRLSDGTPIEAKWRESVRTRHPLVSSLDDPFDTKARCDLIGRLREAAAEVRLGRKDWVLQKEEDLEKRVSSLEEHVRMIESLPGVGPVWRLWRSWKGRNNSRC